MRTIAQALQVSRSNLMRKKGPSKEKASRDETSLVERIKVILQERHTYGYRRVAALLNREQLKENRTAVNLKRVYRIMKAHHLLLQKPKIKPQRTHTGRVQTIWSNIRWCSDAFTIQCINGDKVHVAFSMDTCDREVMRYVASTVGINSQMIRDLMLETMEYRLGQTKTETPIQWLTDNGGCYTARDTIALGRKLGLDIRTTPAYSPESNGMAEAFVKTIKRDYVWFGDLKDAEAVMKQLPGWIEDYNENAPHKALKMLPPRGFIKLQKLAG